MGKSKLKKKPAQVVFNEEERAKYLLGFRKRKAERKLKAKQELEEKIKEERKRQRDLKIAAILKEKSKFEMPLIERKITKREVIERDDHTIIVSDLTNSIVSFNKPDKDSDDENDDDDDDEDHEINEKLDDAVQQDSSVAKSKEKLSKECSIISERLAKLEKKRKSLEKSNTKQKKMLKASRLATKNSKSAKKFQIKDAKIKKRAKLKKIKKSKKSN